MTRVTQNGKNYRSKLEGKVALLLGEDWDYEAHRVPYIISRKYVTDFSKDRLVLEVKGFFRPGDQAKYLAVRDAIEAERKELIFVFANPNKPVRKGAKLTHGKWCEKHDIRYCSVANLKEFLDEET
jgi:hypothetical protein